MRILTAAIVIGPLMLIGALSALADPSISSGTPLRLAAGGDTTSDDTTSDRQTYTQKAREDMQEWQRKLHDLGASAEAKGQEGGTAAERDLNEAWTRTEAASRQLQTVGDEGWESAKATYAKASHDLAEAWHRVHPGDN